MRFRKSFGEGGGAMVLGATVNIGSRSTHQVGCHHLGEDVCVVW